VPAPAPARAQRIPRGRESGPASPKSAPQPIEKRLARNPQLYSRVGLVHHYRPLPAAEHAFVLARHWPACTWGSPDDRAATGAVAAINRITSGNFRLTSRLIAQVGHIPEINQLHVVAKDVAETARESLVIRTT
jgi:hypothetical protein